MTTGELIAAVTGSGGALVTLGAWVKHLMNDNKDKAGQIVEANNNLNNGLREIVALMSEFVHDREATEKHRNKFDSLMIRHTEMLNENARILSSVDQTLAQSTQPVFVQPQPTFAPQVISTKNFSRTICSTDSKKIPGKVVLELEGCHHFLTMPDTLDAWAYLSQNRVVDCPKCASNAIPELRSQQ